MDMKWTRRRVIVDILVLATMGLVAAVAAPFVTMYVVFRKWLRRAERGREHLFLETDYQELLAACRELSKRRPSGGFYHIHLGQRDPETLTFPRVILDLEPALVNVSPSSYGEVQVELFPGPEWFGLIASAEGQEGRGDVKLIDGLWYCDSKYGDEFPRYTRRINAMIEKGRQLRANRQMPPVPLPQQK
jgi:hypothetical protein